MRNSFLKAWAFFYPFILELSLLIHSHKMLAEASARRFIHFSAVLSEAANLKRNPFLVSLSPYKNTQHGQRWAVFTENGVRSCTLNGHIQNLLLLNGFGKRKAVFRTPSRRWAGLDLFLCACPSDSTSQKRLPLRGQLSACCFFL